MRRPRWAALSRPPFRSSRSSFLGELVKAPRERSWNTKNRQALSSQLAPGVEIRDALALKRGENVRRKAELR
jgi:hypothetical protein